MAYFGLFDLRCQMSVSLAHSSYSNNREKDYSVCMELFNSCCCMSFAPHNNVVKTKYLGLDDSRIVRH